MGRGRVSWDLRERAHRANRAGYVRGPDAGSVGAVIDGFVTGKSPKPGSQIGRTASCPAGGATTLKDPSLYDGSAVGAWKKRFEEAAATAKAVEIAPPSALASPAHRRPSRPGLRRRRRRARRRPLRRCIRRRSRRSRTPDSSRSSRRAAAASRCRPAKSTNLRSRRAGSPPKRRSPRRLTRRAAAGGRSQADLGHRPNSSEETQRTRHLSLRPDREMVGSELAWVEDSMDEVSGVAPGATSGSNSGQACDGLAARHKPATGRRDRQMLLEDKDRIFRNIYGFHDAG